MIIGVGKGTKILNLLTLDDKEYVATVKMPLKEALQMAENGKIKDAKTLVLIYKASRRLGI